jgi:hypothetical protein
MKLILSDFPPLPLSACYNPNPNPNRNSPTFLSKKRSFDGLDIDRIFDLELSEPESGANTNHRSEEGQTPESGRKNRIRGEEASAGALTGVLDRVFDKVSQVFDIPRRRSPPAEPQPEKKEKAGAEILSSVVIEGPEGNEELGLCREDEGRSQYSIYLCTFSRFESHKLSWLGVVQDQSTLE